jgi:hypothetical protein
MGYHTGNKSTGLHYWISPPELWAKVCELLGCKREEIFDPGPYRRPDDFNGLIEEWGPRIYINPPFQASMELGDDGKVKKRGLTAWVRKMIAEFHKGKDVVLVFPMDRWITLLMAEGAQMVDMGNVQWESTEDGSQAVAARPIVAFVLKHETK